MRVEIPKKAFKKTYKPLLMWCRRHWTFGAITIFGYTFFASAKNALSDTAYYFFLAIAIFSSIAIIFKILQFLKQINK